jgi:hypothetical protein
MLVTELNFREEQPCLNFLTQLLKPAGELDQQIGKSAEDPFFSIPEQVDPKLTQRAVQDWLDRLKSKPGASR